MSSQAWVTLATNDSYGLGALVLAHSLRRVNSAHPAVVLITPSVTDVMRDRLGAVFAEVVTVDVLDSHDAAHLALLQRPELGVTFTKIHCWNLTQYEKCVFLDADILVVQNCDELFEREELSAAPDVGWPDCFNSGVFVFRPSAETFSRLITFAQERGSFDGGDQGLLNSFFSDWAHADINKHLPFLYNVTSAAFYSYLPALKQYGQNLKIIHFIGATKPWLQHFNWESRSVEAPEHLRGFLQLWWDLFVAHVHSQLDVDMVELEEVPPELPPQDVSQFYSPTLDPTSEFPWHHPDAQINREEINAQEINMADFHDPWDLYRGNIPPIKSDLSNGSTNVNKMSEYHEMRKHAWDYSQTLQNFEQSIQNVHQPNVHYDHNISDQIHHQNKRDQEHHWQSHWDNLQQTNEHRDYGNEQSTSKEDTSYQNQENYDHYYQHNESEQNILHQHFNYHDNQLHLSESPQFIEHNQNTLLHTHSHYTHNLEHHPEDHHDHHANHLHNNISNNIPSQDEPESLCPKSDHLKIHNNHISRDLSIASPKSREKKTEYIYCVHLDHNREKKERRKTRKVKLYASTDNIMNGDVSETDSEDFEDVIPRHPYDGFYLRHMTTVDSRGRKICTHEILTTPDSPPSSPPPESPELLEPLPAEETMNGTEEQSGVAGNLARVVPGGTAFQRDALDELTRRQGWEAGNIDYMGADSFDNIWAKISQTLSQPRTSPPKQSPPKEIVPPPKQPSPPKEIAPTPDPTQDKLVTEVKEQVVEKKLEAPFEADSPLEAPKTVVEPVSVEVPAEVEALAPAEVPLPAVVAAASELPAPVVEAITSAVETLAIKEAPVTATAPVESPTPKTSDQVKSAAPTVPLQSATESVEAPVVPKLVQAAEVRETQTANTQDKIVSIKEVPKTNVEAQEKAPITPDTSKLAKQSEVTPASTALAAAADINLPLTPETLKTKVSSATDSPPLVANTPPKEEAPAVPASKSEERRKPVDKLQLSPPAAADPLPTPDSEFEDAATLAQSIIASELRTPTVTSPSPSASPASPPPIPQHKQLSVDEPQVPTPPIEAVSLAQIGVKPSKGKATIAAQIESSVSDKLEPTTPPTPTTPSEPATPTEVPKKKVLKKVVKKDSSGEAPVPPPRKKEKKPKEK